MDSTLPSLDPYNISYIDMARIKIAIVPIGRIKKKFFKKCIEIISENKILNLEEIPFVHIENSIINNKKPESGKVLLKYVTSHNRGHEIFEDIQPYRRIFGVIGIIDCSQEQDINLELQRYKNLISKKFSTALTRICLASNADDEAQAKIVSLEQTHFFNGEEDLKKSVIGPIKQLTSNIIVKFENLIVDIKKLQIIHSPKPVNPIARENQEYPQLQLQSKPQIKNEQSNLPILPPSVYVSGTSRDINQTNSPTDLSPTASIGLSINPGLQNAVGMLADSRARKLTASRAQKLATDLLLLSGRVSQAVRNYANVIEVLKNNGDLLWQAVCLESYQCALFIEAVQSNDNVKDDTAQNEPSTSLEEFLKTGITIYHTNIKLKTLICELPEKTREVLNIYSRLSENEKKPAYPYLSISACLRMAKLLSIMHNVRLNSVFISGASISLSSTKGVSSPLSSTSESEINIIEPVNGVSKVSISSWLNKAWHGGLNFLNENLKIDICASISAIYGSIGMLRKHAFFLQQTDLMTVTYIRNITQQNAQLPMSPKEKNSQLRSIKTNNLSNESNSDNFNFEKDINNGFIAYPSGELMERVCEIIGIGEKVRTTPLLEPSKDALAWKMRQHEMKQKESLKWDNRQATIKKYAPRPLFHELHYGWPDLQIFMMKQCLEMSLISEDFQKTISFAGRLLRRLHPYLVVSRQKEIADLLRYVLQRRQIELLHQQKIASINKQENKIHYSKLKLSEAGFNIASSLIILNSIDISEYLSRRIPYPYHKCVNDNNNDETSPFIYSPFVLKKARSSYILNENGVSEKMLMVANEPIEFIISFTNTFSFDIEIEGLTIKTSGVKVKSVPVSVVIPSFTKYYQVKIFATPLEAGILKVLGCQVKMFGGSIEEILIPPIEVEKDEKTFDNDKTEDDRDRLLGKSTVEYYKKYKVEQIKKRNNSEDEEPVKEISEQKHWEKSFKVLEEQALIQIKELSLGTQAAIMLFEGEISKFTIKLENIGTIPITYMKLSINEKYGDKRKSNMNFEMADELYEREVYAKGKKTFWLQQTINTGKEEIENDPLPPNQNETEIIPINLMPNEQCELVIGTYGNILCSSGSICIKYGNVNISENESIDEEEKKKEGYDPYYYLRQLDIPIMITVQRGLKVNNADILIFNGNSEVNTLRNFRKRKNQMENEKDKNIDIQNDPYISSSLEELLEMVQFEQKINFNKYCLLTFELNNLWNLSFEVKFTIDEKDRSESIETNVLIDAKCTKRIFLPILRYNLPDSIVKQPIPTPNRQQVSYKIIKLVEHEEMLRRMQFWFKEDLFGGLINGKGKIKATWNCSRIRNGELNLRKLKLTSSMLSTLKMKDITFDVFLVPLKSTKEDSIISSGANGEEISCKMREMVGIKWIIYNHIDKPRKVCIRIEPVQDFDNGLLDYHLQGRMAWSGSLQKVLNEIPAKSSIEYVLPIYFFSPGNFKFIYHCELVGNIKEHSINGENIWWGDSPALIRVV